MDDLWDNIAERWQRIQWDGQIGSFDYERWLLRVGSFGVVATVLLMFVLTLILRSLHRPRQPFEVALAVTMTFLSSYLYTLMANYAGADPASAFWFTTIRTFLLISGIIATPFAAWFLYYAFYEEVVLWLKNRRAKRDPPIPPRQVAKAIIEPWRWGRDSRVGSAEEPVFDRLTEAMPICVSDSGGTIRYTTHAFDALVGAEQDELFGHNLTELMPLRYRERHLQGMTRFLATGIPTIIGTVVAVEMLRRDGTEVPIHLALTSTTTDGNVWFVAAIWMRNTEGNTPWQE